MDQDDPEKRIAELERQLADARAAGDPGANQGYKMTGSRLTAQRVRDVAFSKPPLGKRGYNEDEVDAFLDLVEAALRDPTGRTLTTEQVRDVAFSKPPLGKRGYNEDEVDAFLDLVEEQMPKRFP
jgi:DivIVA domain-containing protein